MSTPAALCFRHNNKLHVTIVHDDGDPSWTGTDVVQFCRKLAQQNLWDAFTAKLEKLHFVHWDARPAKQWREHYKESFQHVSHGDNWYAYLRSLQGVETFENILSGHLTHWIELGEMQLKGEHYGYCVNLDNHTFEFWYDGEIKFASSLDSLNINWKKG